MPKFPNSERVSQEEFKSTLDAVVILERHLSYVWDEILTPKQKREIPLFAIKDVIRMARKLIKRESLGPGDII